MIVLNGNASEQGAGQTVAQVLVLLELGSEPRGVAVAVDGEVIPRAGWSSFTVPEGACVEVLTAMQGG